MSYSTQLFMFLPTLQDLPPIPTLPDGYAIRCLSEGIGDEAMWEDIIRDSFKDEKISFSMLTDEPIFSKERVVFVTCNDKPVATTCALGNPEKYGNDCGLLHMVGCNSEHLGKRLGYTVCLASLHALRNLGYQSAILSTDDFRIPAIKTYNSLGFLIQMTDPTIPSRWNAICKVIASDNSNKKV